MLSHEPRHGQNRSREWRPIVDSTRLVLFSGAALVGPAFVPRPFGCSRFPLSLLRDQTFRVGAILSIFGVAGLYLCLRALTGWLGLVAYVVAVLGAIFAFGDGIIALRHRNLL